MHKCVLRCTRPRAVGHPIRRYKVGDLVTLEADDYGEFVVLCANHAIHFEELVEGEWPDKPHPAYKAKLSPRRTFAQRVIDKGSALLTPTPKQVEKEVEEEHVCEICGQSFASEEALERHVKRHKKRKKKK